MTFLKWYTFNFVDNHIMNNLGDMYIKIFRKKSFNTEDKCLEVLMRIDDAVSLFGNYQIMKIGMHSESHNGIEYKALCALLYLSEENK